MVINLRAIFFSKSQQKVGLKKVCLEIILISASYDNIAFSTKTF